MKVQDINAILTAGQLAPMGRDELLAIARSDDGPRFHAALLKLHAGDVDQVAVLEPIITRQAAPTAAVRQATEPRSSTPAPAPYFNFHVYGKAAALCISEAQTRSTGRRTIQIEGAVALEGGARRAYDWVNKLIVQLSEQEMFMALNLFERRIDRVEFKGHGRQHEKFLTMEHQHTSVAIHLGARGRQKIIVPVGQAESFQFISLCYQQIQANAPHMDTATIRQMIAQVAMTA